MNTKNEPLLVSCKTDSRVSRIFGLPRTAVPLFLEKKKKKDNIVDDKSTILMGLVLSFMLFSHLT